MSRSLLLSHALPFPPLSTYLYTPVCIVETILKLCFFTRATFEIFTLSDWRRLKYLRRGKKILNHEKKYSREQFVMILLSSKTRTFILSNKTNLVSFSCTGPNTRTHSFFPSLSLSLCPVSFFTRFILVGWPTRGNGAFRRNRKRTSYLCFRR